MSGTCALDYHQTSLLFTMCCNRQKTKVRSHQAKIEEMKKKGINNQGKRSVQISLSPSLSLSLSLPLSLSLSLSPSLSHPLCLCVPVLCLSDTERETEVFEWLPLQWLVIWDLFYTPIQLRQFLPTAFWPTPSRSVFFFFSPPLLLPYCSL